MYRPINQARPFDSLRSLKMTEGADVVGVDIITRALSIRQPYAEQILRGVKTAEFRSRPTKVTHPRV